MRKSRVFLSMALCASMMYFSGCNRNDDDVTPAGTPEPNPVVHTHSAITLGDQFRTNAQSFYNALDHRAYSEIEAAENPSEIDMVYFYHADRGATLAAPSDDVIIETSAFPDLMAWGARDVTYFRYTDLTPAQFDAISEGRELLRVAGVATDPDPDNGNVQMTNIKGLEEGSVIAFQNAEFGRYGLLKVVSLERAQFPEDGGQPTGGTITFEVKVAE